MSAAGALLRAGQFALRSFAVGAEPLRARAETSLAPAREGRDPDRFELKFWVPEARLPELIRLVREHLRQGRHDQIIERQCITSLYLDTPDWRFFDAHVESSVDRFKLRVRVYGDPPRGNAFFEVKRKVKSITVKSRAPISPDRVASIVDGTYDQLPPLGATERRHLENFLYLQTVTHARPAVLVRAYREAYASIDPADDIRVTFDRHMACQPARGATFDCDPDGWLAIDGPEQHGRSGPHALLELKFPRIAPGWMGDVATRLGLERIAYSKYVWAVRTLRGQSSRDAALLDLAPTRRA